MYHPEISLADCKGCDRTYRTGLHRGLCRLRSEGHAFIDRQLNPGISYELHFPSQSVFGKYFKRVTGLSPKQYRMTFR
ncbi:MAG: AraC family transcriptional regulator [Candidatus Cryptobacteroides sp.]